MVSYCGWGNTLTCAMKYKSSPIPEDFSSMIPSILCILKLEALFHGENIKVTQSRVVTVLPYRSVQSILKTRTA